MTNGGYPDEETILSVDDEDDDVATDSTDAIDGAGESEPREEKPAKHPHPSPQDEPRQHTYGANSQQLTDERRAAVTEDTHSESDSPAPTEGSESGAGSGSDGVGLLEGGLTKHELIAFVGGFIASYALAAVFYWGIITTGGFSDVPTAMWILLGVVVLAPLALMFGLRETSSIAGTILNRGNR